MAKTAVEQWDVTAANNTDINSIPIDGAVTTPSQVDNIIREMMAQVASQMGEMNFEGADIASATTTNLANATGWSLDVTGTTTITGFGTVDAGQLYILRFVGALTLTHNSTSLILPGAANITTAANDVAFMKSEGSGNWRCVSYQKAAGLGNVVREQAFTSSGTYTPHANMVTCIIEAVGGGGAGGGAAGVTNVLTAGAGGGAGGYSRTVSSKATIGVSQTVTIGAAGAAGAAGGVPGGDGGITSVGALCIANGGAGGGSSSGTPIIGVGGAGGAAGTGGVAVPGATGTPGFVSTAAGVFALSGPGASGPFGAGGVGVFTANGAAASGYGTGGSGGHSNSVTNRAGGAGTAGYVLITEFCSG